MEGWCCGCVLGEGSLRWLCDWCRDVVVVGQGWQVVVVRQGEYDNFFGNRGKFSGFGFSWWRWWWRWEIVVVEVLVVGVMVLVVMGYEEGDNFYGGGGRLLGFSGLGFGGGGNGGGGSDGLVLMVG